MTREAPGEFESAPTARQPGTPFADPLIGMVVAERYRIVEAIGRGGMGVVYKAEHARIGKLIALKLLTGALSRDPGLVARFEREAAMVSRLSHPNTVQVFDFGHADGLVYLAMEYLRGFDLGHIIGEQGALDVERTARIIVQVCGSLSEAHERGIVHRDLKPENVMVLGAEQNVELVKVLDFGLAKLRESTEASNLTLRGTLVGTPYYMSPEQIRGEPVGPAGDVYALGALMYSCLTGDVVFDGSSPIAILTRHLTERPLPPSARAPGRAISPGVDRVVMTALEKDPGRRFPNAAALRQALLDELRVTSRSVELLLDSKNLRELSRAEADAATRDEVESYERKLRRRGYLAWGALGAFLVAAAAGGLRAYARLTAEPEFAGVEREPNNGASTALAVPFPLEVKGQLGQRLDPERSDRDFYRVLVPGSAAPNRLSVAPLPNMALCVSVYGKLSDQPLARYCPGAPNRALDIDVRLPAGEYLLAVMQDREAYTAAGSPPVHENVSDAYTLALRPSTASTGEEVEPNDTQRDATVLAPGAELRGTLGFMRDVDVVCATPGTGNAVFTIEDSKDRVRPEHAVLQITPTAGDDAGIPVRVHQAGRRIPSSPRDVLSPLATRPMPRAEPPAAACVELTLVPNPWAPTPLPLVAPAGKEQYVVRVELE